MPTTGLFRIVRQPIYVAFALTLWTVPTWTPDQLAVALVLTTYCLVGPLLKERRFKRRFGQIFVAYANCVPYWLPWPRPPIRRNDLSIYDVSADWWGGETRWLRTLQNLVPARFAFFDPIVGDWRGEAVLDLGCGGGFMAVALSERGAKVTGVDPSAAAIAAARRQAKANDLEIDYRVAGGENLPFANGVFDIVVCVTCSNMSRISNGCFLRFGACCDPMECSCLTLSTKPGWRRFYWSRLGRTSFGSSLAALMTQHFLLRRTNWLGSWRQQASMSGVLSAWVLADWIGGSTCFRLVAYDGNPVSGAGNSTIISRVMNS